MFKLPDPLVFPGDDTTITGVQLLDRITIFKAVQFCIQVVVFEFKAPYKLGLVQ